MLLQFNKISTTCLFLDINLAPINRLKIAALQLSIEIIGWVLFLGAHQHLQVHLFKRLLT